MMYITDKEGERIGEINLYDPKAVEVAPDRKRVALVVGHDTKEGGAFGDRGQNEYNFNCEFLDDLSIDGKTFNNGVEIRYFFRSPNLPTYSKKMSDLHNRLDEWGADIAIEFHFNSFSDATVNGHEVLFCGMDARANGLATALNDNLDKNLPATNRGIKMVSRDSRGGGFCCNGKSVSLIIEPFFGANQDRFSRGGDLREPYKSAILGFLSQL